MTNRAARRQSRKSAPPILGQQPVQIRDVRMERCRVVVLPPAFLDACLRQDGSYALEMSGLDKDAQLFRAGMSPDGNFVLFYYSPDWPINLDPANLPTIRIAWHKLRVLESGAWTVEEAEVDGA